MQEPMSIVQKLKTAPPTSTILKNERGYDYISHYNIFTLANRAFGEMGWTYEITDGPKVIFQDANNVVMQANALVRLQSDDGYWLVRSDVGTSCQQNGKGLNAEQWETASKGAVTDAVKTGVTRLAAVRPRAL